MMVNLEEELENYRKKCMELENKYDNLLIENKVLECEKTKAETEVSSLKEKVEELVTRVCELESNLKSKNNEEFCTLVRTELKKMSPCTPGVSRALFPKVFDISNEEDIDESKVHSLNTVSAKRKRNDKIILSDDDISSDDDNAPICTLKRPRRFGNKTDSEDENDRETGKSKTDSENETEEDPSKPQNQDNRIIDLHKADSSSEGSEFDGSESEGDSLGGFIVKSSESDSERDSVSGDSCDELEDGSNDLEAALENIGRKKVLKLKWELEGDMLADFGKDPEVCMRAVCALYRKQTEDEKACKDAIYHNKSGFSQPDAFRGCELAEFLTDGDPEGDLNKTVDKLKQYDSNGIKLCTKLATKYSKQLFKIYHNNEDPFFRPQ